MKNVKEREADMRDIIEEYAEKRARMAVAEAERENNKKIVVKLSAKGMSVEEIASILEITEEQVRELADKRSA
ncbi:hypothetical protein [Phascolarctobacterium succinatutens]|nr:hypothetical protein [Phascolarctobacterium succinatutens]